MANTMKRFGYKIIKMEKTGQMPSNPSVFLNLRYWGSDGEGGAPHVLLSLTSGEIDDYIKVLKADLDAVGKRAKKALTNARAAASKMAAERISK